MKTPRYPPLSAALFALAALTAALTVPAIPTALAATPIQRCEASDGTVIYTDKACAAHDAQRTPISGELLGRIARDEAARDSTAEAGFDGAVRPATATAIVARRSASSGCARTPTQLSMDLQGAWALGDVNRIAESYHWPGLDHRQGQRIMQRLDRLSGQPLLQAEFFNAQIGSGPMQLVDASSDGPGAAGVMQLMFGEGGSRSVQDFDVQRYRGCYFIKF